MLRLRHRPGFIAVLLTALLSIAALGVSSIAFAQATFPGFGPYGTPVNGCDNPILAYDTTGWVVDTTGATATRGQPMDHVVANWDYNVHNTAAGSVRVLLPRRNVVAGQAWEFSIDVRTNGDPANTLIQADWYNASGAYLTSTPGPSVAIPGTRPYTRVAGTFTAPAGAASVIPIEVTSNLNANSSVAATMCTYRPAPVAPPTTTPAPTTVPPTTVPPTTVPPTTVPPTTVPPTTDPPMNTADLSAYGAHCDGTANDRAALAAGVADMTAKHGVLTVSGVCRIIATGAAPVITLPGAVTIRGITPNATLALDTDSSGGFRKLFDVRGNDVTLETVTLRRVSNVYGIMLSLNGPDRLRMDRVTIDGQRDVFGAQEFHGLSIEGSGGQLLNAVMVNSTVKNTGFGLFQDSAVTAPLDGFTVDHSTFSGNFWDDLEFNAPSGSMTNVRVTNSTFTNNKRDPGNYGAGFGVGFANVNHSLIQGNTFDGYPFEPVHIEDRSAFVTVDNNQFRNSFFSTITSWASHVFIINASHDITVTNNLFDTAGNHNGHLDAVYVGAGGGAGVNAVAITGNTFRLIPNASAVGIYGATNVTQSGNIVVVISLSTSTPPTGPAPPPVGDPTEAGAARNWGAPRFVDDFNRTTVGSNWTLYNGTGHNGNGRRVPSAWSMNGQYIRVTGASNGDSGGASLNQSLVTGGKIETRMRAAAGDKDYHPVLLLWPDAEDWPVGGEVDYSETFAANRQQVNFFLHYSASNQQTSASKAIDVTQWHNYAVDWTATCITGYIDNVQWFQDCNPAHLPPRKVHPTIQLDAFRGTGPYVVSTMDVDWMKLY